ncbi:hypothetical protein ACWGOQ_0017975 [Aquimarina sp. M1]
MSNENDRVILYIDATNLSVGSASYSIRVSDAELFVVVLLTERISKECCDMWIFSDIEIQNSEFEFDENRGIYTFILD